MKNVLVILTSCGFLIFSPLLAQKSPIPPEKIPLENLDVFKATTANWNIVGDVFYDLNGGKSKIENGDGILLNTLQKGNNDAIMTSFEHGDMELELDFMMPKGSNSGIYFQGRYEVQLFDSWGINDPKYSDVGAIYQRWDVSRGSGKEGFEGHPPFINVARAPGLWQNLKVVFKAPRFDAQGNKTQNAKFESVYLNDVLVQKNVEITGPTQAAFFDDEKPLGPLAIQGDHGGVAIRNIAYKTFGTESVALKDMKLTYYDSIKTIDDFTVEAPKGTMEIDVLDHLAPASRNEFAGVIEGDLTLPSNGDYFFSLNLEWVPDDTPPGIINGAGKLFIDDKEVLEVDGVTGKANASVQLSAGNHKLKLMYFKSFGYWYARSNNITLNVESKSVSQTALNVPLRAVDPVSKIAVNVGEKTQTQRGFLMHQGEKRTHTMAVGEPGGANYAVDLSSGELLGVWRGGFVETTPMWHGRGETQLMLPMGDLIEFEAKPSIAILSDKNQAWPKDAKEITYEGYQFMKNGEPVVKYFLAGNEIIDTFVTEGGGKRLTRTIQVIPTAENSQFYCRVAEGSTIEKLPNGLYAIDDKKYYIEFEGKVSPEIRSTAEGKKEMILPVQVKDGMGSVGYSFVW